MATIETVKDLFIGIFILLISLTLVIIIINNLSNLLINIKTPFLIVFILHVFLIIGFIYLLRINMQKIIKDKELFSSIMTLAGPTLAASLYFSQYIKGFATKWNNKNL